MSAPNEASLLDSGEIVIPHLTAIQRIMSSAERGFHKALTVLRQLQKDCGFVPQPAEPRLQGAVKLTAESSELTPHSGFVPPPCSETRHKISNKQESA